MRKQAVRPRGREGQSFGDFSSRLTSSSVQARAWGNPIHGAIEQRSIGYAAFGTNPCEMAAENLQAITYDDGCGQSFMNRSQKAGPALKVDLPAQLTGSFQLQRSDDRRLDTYGMDGFQ